MAMLHLYQFDSSRMRESNTPPDEKDVTPVPKTRASPPTRASPRSSLDLKKSWAPFVHPSWRESRRAGPRHDPNTVEIYRLLRLKAGATLLPSQNSLSSKTPNVGHQAVLRQTIGASIGGPLGTWLGFPRDSAALKLRCSKWGGLSLFPEWLQLDPQSQIQWNRPPKCYQTYIIIQKTAFIDLFVLLSRGTKAPTQTASFPLRGNRPSDARPLRI